MFPRIRRAIADVQNALAAHEEAYSRLGDTATHVQRKMKEIQDLRSHSSIIRSFEELAKPCAPKPPGRRGG